MTTQSIYAMSELRRISYQAGGVPSSVEMDVTGKIQINADLVKSYVIRVAGLLRDLAATTTNDQKTSIVARLNVIRQELAYITGKPLEPINITLSSSS